MISWATTGSRLPALAQILHSEANEIHGGRGGNANHLVLFELSGPAGIVRHMLLSERFHRYNPPLLSAALANLVQVIDKAGRDELINKFGFHKALRRNPGRNRARGGELF